MTECCATRKAAHKVLYIDKTTMVASLELAFFIQNQHMVAVWRA